MGYTKQQAKNNLLGWKRNARLCDQRCRKAIGDIQALKKAILLLKKSPFLKAKIMIFEEKIKSIERHLVELNKDRAGAYEKLIDCVLYFDKHFDSSAHEKAQLLGVHHVHVERMVAEHGDVDLLLAISLHGELAGEDWSRGHVLLSAYICEQTKLFNKSAGFRDDIMGMLQKMAVENTGHPLQTYKQNANGDMIAQPPKLTVVK
jgi:hypothetical protein